MRPRDPFLVFVGGALGTLTRALLIDLAPGLQSPFPLTVLTINLTGAFILAVVYALADEVGLLSSGVRLVLAVGFLGGFTTFSTFAWDADLLLGRHPVLAGAFVMASMLGGVLASILGLLAGRRGIEWLERGARRVVLHFEERRHLQQPDGDMAVAELEDREESA